MTRNTATDRDPGQMGGQAKRTRARASASQDLPDSGRALREQSGIAPGLLTGKHESRPPAGADSSILGRYCIMAQGTVCSKHIIMVQTGAFCITSEGTLQGSSGHYREGDVIKDPADASADFDANLEVDVILTVDAGIETGSENREGNVAGQVGASPAAETDSLLDGQTCPKSETMRGVGPMRGGTGHKEKMGRANNAPKGDHTEQPILLGKGHCSYGKQNRLVSVMTRSRSSAAAPLLLPILRRGPRTNL